MTLKKNCVKKNCLIHVISRMSYLKQNPLIWNPIEMSKNVEMWIDYAFYSIQYVSIRAKVSELQR